MTDLNEAAGNHADDTPAVPAEPNAAEAAAPLYQSRIEGTAMNKRRVIRRAGAAAAATVLTALLVSACNSGLVEKPPPTPAPSPEPSPSVVTPEPPVPAPTPEPTPLEDPKVVAMRKMKELGDSINTLSARISMTVRTPGAPTATLSGTLRYKRGTAGRRGKYLITLSGRAQEPNKTRRLELLMDGDRLDALSDDSVYESCVSAASSQMNVPKWLMNTGQFFANFNTDYSEDVSPKGGQTAIFKLTPKRRDALELIQAWVNKADWLPTELYLLYRHEQTRLRISVPVSSLKINPRLGDAVFRLTRPPDASVTTDPCRQSGQ